MTDQVPSPPHHTEPGWYPDPDEIVGTGRLRYWDGHRWTDHHAQAESGTSGPAGTPRRITEQNLLVAAIVLVVIVGALVVVNALRSDAAVPQLDRNLSSSGPAV